MQVALQALQAPQVQRVWALMELQARRDLQDPQVVQQAQQDLQDLQVVQQVQQDLQDRQVAPQELKGMQAQQARPGPQDPERGQ